MHGEPSTAYFILMPRALLSLSRARLEALDRPLPSAFLVLDAYGVFGSIYTPYGSLLFPNNLLIKPIYLSHGSLNSQTKYGSSLLLFVR
jgi:hypothetical protein